MRWFCIASAIVFICAACTGEISLERRFQNPPAVYKPMPLWHLNGELTAKNIQQQMNDAKLLAGFSGVAVLPLSDRSDTLPGTTPAFLTEAFFDRYMDIL